MTSLRAFSFPMIDYVYCERIVLKIYQLELLAAPINRFGCYVSGKALKSAIWEIDIRY